MNRSEFLEELRRTLMGEVGPDIIEQNIRYYDDYIKSNPTKNEADVISELGSPRLIAKTIIESDKIAKSKGKYKGSSTSQNTVRNDNSSYDQGRYYNNSHRNVWRYQKTIFWIVLIMLILIFIFIARILFRLIYIFAVPLIIVMLFMSLLKKR